MKEVWKALKPQEKKMLYVLLVFLLLMGGWFYALKPTLETYTKQKSVLSQKQAQLSSLRAQLTQYQNAPSQLAVQTSTYNSLTKRYYAVLKNEKISQMITTQIENVGMEPQNLTISDTASGSSSSSSSSSSDTSDQTTSSRLKTAYVNVDVTGTLTQLSRLLANVEGSMKSVGVTNLEYAADTTDSSSSSEDTVTITFAVYMIKK